MQKPIPARRSVGLEDVPSAHPEPETLTLHRSPDPMTIHIRTCPHSGRETYCYLQQTDDGVVLHTERGSRPVDALAWLDAHHREIETVETTRLESTYLRYALQGKLDDAAEAKGIGPVSLALRHIHNSRTLADVERVDDASELGITEHAPGPYEGTATEIARGGRRAAA